MLTAMVSGKWAFVLVGRLPRRLRIEMPLSFCEASAVSAWGRVTGSEACLRSQRSGWRPVLPTE